MKHILLATCALLIFFNLKTEAQVYCKNDSSEPVWLSLAYHYTPKTGDKWQEGNWVSEGWYYIPTGTTKQIHNFIGIDENVGLAYEFYYFAFQPEKKEWTGYRPFLTDIDPNKDFKSDLLDFRIYQADLLDAYPENIFLVPFKFRFATGQRFGTYTIVLKDTD
ncbi:MAG: hypothetical protein IPM47_15195 [Sphingobacteriales bacterium]|nr:MAG: hypothetical protein IPM47_15195 [Sphingobacteriales bacterium]